MALFRLHVNQPSVADFEMAPQERGSEVNVALGSVGLGKFGPTLNFTEDIGRSSVCTSVSVCGAGGQEEVMFLGPLVFESGV